MPLLLEILQSPSLFVIKTEENHNPPRPHLDQKRRATALLAVITGRM